VGKIEVRARLDAFKQRTLTQQRHLIPAHLWHRQPGIGEAAHLSRYKRQPGHVALFVAAQQQLHPQAHAQKWGAAPEGRAHRVIQPLFFEEAHGRARRAHARQHHRFGALHSFGAINHLRRQAQMLEGAADAAQVPGPIIHNCYH
jgi:hypothetical protein